MKRGSQVVAAVGGLAAGTLLAGAAGNRRWERATARMAAQLSERASVSADRAFSAEDLQGLPAPVARYFRFALTLGQPLLAQVRLCQEGELRLGGFGSSWKRFTAVQHLTADPPGFLWDARIFLGPWLPIQVRDSYIGGMGSGQMRIASLFSLAGQSHRPDIDAGSLHRYLAEAVWCPTALLPSRGVQWEFVSDDTARATLAHGGAKVALEFSFSDQGEIVRAYTPARFREVNGTFVSTPWVCRYRDYSLFHGMRVPLQGEMEWLLPEGRFPCFRSRLLNSYP